MADHNCARCSLSVQLKKIIRNLPEEKGHGRLQSFYKDRQNSDRALSERRVYRTVLGQPQSVAIQSAKCEQNSSAPTSMNLISFGKCHNSS